MNVNKGIFEVKWEQIRAQSKGWWILFSDEDLTKVEKTPIKLDKYALMIRVKYGYAHDHARQEINQRITDLDTNPPSSESMRDSLDRQASAKVPKVWKSRMRKSNL
jgi:hypothetical protein